MIYIAHRCAKTARFARVLTIAQKMSNIAVNRVVKKPQSGCKAVDSLAKRDYNTYMTTRRTPRQDCNYIIYAMTSVVTLTLA